MKEIVMLSGKGGTGKTSLTAVFAAMMRKPVVVDCDVDAANLHLLLNPTIEERHDFTGGAKARVDATACNGCGLCVDGCRFDALHLVEDVAVVEPLHCEGCGACAQRCPPGAISLEAQSSGEWFLSRTGNGQMLHARLSPGQDNSGMLVAALRRSARALARRNGASWILVDGPPGTGCPVISSLTGADYAVMVTEPTLSGFADLQRVAAVADHFLISTGIIVNKADINPDVARRIEGYAAATGRDVLGRIQYDPAFTTAQLLGSTVLGAATSALRQRLEDVWCAVEHAVHSKRFPIAVIR